MSIKAVSWILLAVLAVAGVLLLNYWASFQPLSTLVYTGIVMALCGLANIGLPFRFMGVRKRRVGALVLATGVTLGLAALLWPARTIRVAQHTTVLDEALPEYQFGERHSVRVHAHPEQVMQATREVTFGDLTSFVTLMRVRGAALRAPFDASTIEKKPILDALGAPALARNEHEVVMGWIATGASRGPKANNLQEFVAYRQGGVKMAFNFYVEDAGDGWSTVSTETRVLALDDFSRPMMARYWRLIVPGSGLLRHEWLHAIKRRAETTTTSKA